MASRAFAGNFQPLCVETDQPVSIVGAMELLKAKIDSWKKDGWEVKSMSAPGITLMRTGGPFYYAVCMTVEFVKPGKEQ